MPCPGPNVQVVGGVGNHTLEACGGGWFTAGRHGTGCGKTSSSVEAKGGVEVQRYWLHTGNIVLATSSL